MNRPRAVSYVLRVRRRGSPVWHDLPGASRNLIKAAERLARILASDSENMRRGEVLRRGDGLTQFVMVRSS